MENIGDRIRTVREGKKLSQEALAGIMSVTPATINRYEKGHRVPDADFLNQMVSALDCDAGWLLTGKHQIAESGAKWEVTSVHRKLTLREEQILEAMQDVPIAMKAMEAFLLLPETDQYIYLGRLLDEVKKLNRGEPAKIPDFD